MHIKMKQLLFAVLSIMIAFPITTFAADKTISLFSNSSNNVTVSKNESFTVQIEVNNATEIAGASFTVTYDTNNLSLENVESSFFDTFANQITTPTSVTVDSVTYYSPLVYADSSSGSMLAAARVDNGSGTDVVIFTLTFNATGTAGTYPISVSQSTITNASAGYTSPTNIPFFVGISGDTYPTHTVSTINGLSVTIGAEFVDTDGDGIDDNWEITNRPDGVDPNASDVLDYFTATGDYDGDGYSDYQEYLNRNESDPQNAAYDPVVKNAPHGTGYRVKALPAVNLLLLQ